MQEHEVMRKLRMLAVEAYGKIWKNRFKGGPNQPAPGKWPETGFVDGVRDWTKIPVSALTDKLIEETQELLAEAHATHPDHIALRLEAADVTAVSMFLADFHGAFGHFGSVDIPKIVCLCGSTRFKEQFMQANYEETMKGNIVLSVGFYHHADLDKPLLLPAQKRALDQLHLRKIDISDEILVINVGGYVGESTLSEIAYCNATGKAVRFLEHGPEQGNRE
jgi:hypothetical protein